MSVSRLRMAGVSKRFGATSALEDVTFEVRSGEVHALIGENGAGKSTLMKILSGAHRPDAGSIELDGQHWVPEDPHHARRCGISMIYQELTLAPDLTVAENILLGEEPGGWGWVNAKELGRLARGALAQLRHDSIPLDAPARQLPAPLQQIVEIARALVRSPRVVIMDEPTSSLTQEDAEQLFQVIGRLKNAGVSVIYISHFLEECQRVCDRYTVLRDGRSVATGSMASADLGEIVRHMIGRQISEIYPRSARQPGAPVLEARGLRGRAKPRAVDFTLRAGEIFGIAGLVGAGRTETVRVCFGLDRLAAGRLVILGREVKRATPSSNLGLGVGMVSEDRKNEGLMLGRSVADNLMLTRFGSASRFGLIREPLQRAAAAAWIERVRIKALDPFQAVGELSGGNQQKVAIGRLLHHDASVLLLDEPTRGIDVGSKAEIYRLLDQLACAGKAVLFVSSYLPELLGVCDRIGVMSRGVLAAVRPAAQWTEHSIMEAAIGWREEPAATAA